LSLVWFPAPLTFSLIPHTIAPIATPTPASWTAGHVPKIPLSRSRGPPSRSPEGPEVDGFVAVPAKTGGIVVGQVEAFSVTGEVVVDFLGILSGIADI
jgi:hypothetical protein